MLYAFRCTFVYTHVYTLTQNKNKYKNVYKKKTTELVTSVILFCTSAPFLQSGKYHLFDANKVTQHKTNRLWLQKCAQYERIYCANNDLSESSAVSKVNPQR